MTKSNYKLTKEDFKQINRRSLFTFQLGWNYERMQGSGYLYTILPQLRKIYGDDTPELKEIMKTHTQFFNRIRQKSPILYRWVMNAVRYEGYR
ncbi:PTS system mannose/fructose/sorbose family transporter subunit IID, partial [Enterococcus faecium]|uniref:PTS system mannose/fructose/sorbose family transporter subunit IID n=1 Tax=Enterococcus faecium TaxID=1352 RepID=UPI003F42737A